MSAAIQIGVFRREGEYWSVGSAGTPVRLKDSRGLAYIAYLLRHPGTEFHALDLVGGIGSESDEKSTARLGLSQENLEQGGFHIGRLGDAGEVLDDQAKRAYRQRLSELREELEEAKTLAKVERAEQLEQEIAALTAELSRAVGLGGRSRRAASASERARQSVTKAIKAVVQRIARSDAALGGVLSRAIMTGSFCSYQPNAESPIEWEFGTTIEPSGQPTSGARGSSAEPDDRPASSVVLGLVPFSTPQRTRFVGRENESRAIQAAVARARAGSGSLMMLAGGPGVGKTRLATEMAEYAASDGFACLLGRCYERDEPLPYLPFVQIIETMLAQAPSLDQFRHQMEENAGELAQLVPSLRRIFPDIPESPELPDPQKRRYIFQSVAEVLQRAARTHPHLLIVDDLHWADESSLALLTYLANGIAQVPLVIIATYRDQYSDDHPAFARTLEELLRQGVRPLKVPGLSKDSVAEMLDELSQRHVPAVLVNAIFEESNGNPFFVEEVYRHLVEEGRVIDASGQFRSEFQIHEIEVPDNVRLIIARRLQRFSDLEIRTLSAAAVIGRSFSFQLLSAISQIEVDGLFNVLEKAQRMGIIIPSSEGPEKPFTFAHELVRQTLLAGISSARRQQLHAKVAAAIERLYPAGISDNAGEIADHLVKAGTFADREAVVRWLIHAGNAALEAAAFDEARANFDSALSRIGESDPRRRAELLDSMGFAQRGLGRWNEALRHWEEALDVYTLLDDREGIAKTCFRLAQVAFRIGGWREAAEIGERGIGRLTGVSSDRALLLAGLAVFKVIDGDPRAAQETLNTALTLSEELADNKLKGAILAISSEINFYLLRLNEALEDSRRSAELSPMGGRQLRAEGLLWRQTTLYHLGRVQEAAETSAQLEPLARRTGYSEALTFYRQMAAWADFWKRPDLIRLEECLQNDLDANTDAGLKFFVAVSLDQLSIAEFLRGDWEKALLHAQAAWRPEAPHLTQAVNTGIRFRLKAYAGYRDAALALLNRNREMFPRPSGANTYASWAASVLAVEGLFVLGEREQAAGLYPLMRELIATGAIFMVMISRFPQTAAGISAAAGRNWNVAEEHFRIGLEQAEAFPNQLEQTEIWRFHAMMLLDRGTRGDRREARKLLNVTLESYTRIGMRRHVELTRDLLSKAS